MNMATKFKPLDIVENIHTGELEMVANYIRDWGFSTISYLNNGVIWYGMRRTKDYRKLSYKDVKINLGNRTKINFETVTNSNYKVIPKKYIELANSRLRKKKINPTTKPN